GSLMTLRDIVALLHEASARAQASDGSPEAPPQAHARASGTAVPGHWTRVLLEAVAEKTGYPAEMLELDMRLDADLGIDSIKRVEILSAVQDRFPEARAIRPEHAGTLQTLRQIAEFLSAGPRPVPTAASGPVPAPPDVHRNGTAVGARDHSGADV